MESTTLIARAANVEKETLYLSNHGHEKGYSNGINFSLWIWAYNHLNADFLASGRGRFVLDIWQRLAPNRVGSFYTHILARFRDTDFGRETGIVIIPCTADADNGEYHSFAVAVEKNQGDYTVYELNSGASMNNIWGQVELGITQVIGPHDTNRSDYVHPLQQSATCSVFSVIMGIMYLRSVRIRPGNKSNDAFHRVLTHVSRVADNVPYMIFDCMGITDEEDEYGGREYEFSREIIELLGRCDLPSASAQIIQSVNYISDFWRHSGIVSPAAVSYLQDFVQKYVATLTEASYEAFRHSIRLTLRAPLDAVEIMLDMIHTFFGRDITRYKHMLAQEYAESRSEEGVHSYGLSRVSEGEVACNLLGAEGCTGAKLEIVTPYLMSQYYSRKSYYDAEANAESESDDDLHG